MAPISPLTHNKEALKRWNRYQVRINNEPNSSWIMFPNQGYYGNDKRQKVEISPLILPPPPPPPPAFPGMLHPPHIGVGGVRKEACSYNYNRRGRRGGRIQHFGGRGENRRGRGKE